ncbi:unnamed protein product [Candidula unifasciata]|uniref:Uncharacterized protein n=1 Tax=Candidula unifasciata TaxID=100452 RepID=A0A8S3YJA6_9EUPU|nr:unnamed protein product [Candidula unifasciata]
MHTVIRWRRPSEIESSRSFSGANPCSNLLGNSICYVISGCLLLVVGVIITSLTFQNLDGTSAENKERYAGPVLIAAGALVMARGALSRLWPRRRTMSARRRSLLRRYIREIYNRPIFALQNSSSFSLCDIQVSDLCHVTSRTRLYSDDPPSYEIVTSDEYHVHAYTNPASDGDDEEHTDTTDPPVRMVISPSPEPTPPSEEPCPPPTYEDYMNSTMKTTSL